jgi:hypothetical protein
MKTLLAKLGLILLPVAAMVGINIAVDPAHAIREGPERQAAAMLVAGKRVGGLVNLDERLLEKYYIASLGGPKDVVVVGSSRSMQIRGEMFAPASFFNSSVSSALYHDLVAISASYAERGLLPKRLILGVDPWTLNPHAAHDGWTVLREPYDWLALQTGTRVSTAAPSLIPERFSALMSPSYFQAALRDLRAHGGQSRGPDEALPDDPRGMIDSDGSHVYPTIIRERTREQVRTESMKFAVQASIDPLLGQFTALDHVSLTQLDVLVTFLIAHHTTVELFLAPFHPLTTSLLHSSPDFRMVPIAERAFRQLAKRRSVRVLGSFDAAVTGCDETEFFDGMHPRPSCVAKILAAPPYAH